MTHAQLNSFQQSLGNSYSLQIANNDDNGDTVYLFVWSNNHPTKTRLLYIFVIVNNILIKRIEVDGYLRSYVLNALEKALKK